MKIVEVKIDNRTVQLRLIHRDGDHVEIEVDGKYYNLDMTRLNHGVYSILNDGKSYNIDLVQGKSAKEYIGHSHYNTYNVSIIDAEAKYLMSRQKDDLDDGNVISSPMSGKVVRIPVKEGQQLKAGDTAIVVSAMKMESEYKVNHDKVVKKILVKNDDIIEANQPLVILE